VDTIPALLERLGDIDLEVRRAAILALGNLGKGNSKVEEALTKFTKDPDPVTQLDAIVAMAELGKMDASTIPHLMKALGSNKETTNRAAIKALRQFAQEKPQDVMPGLLENLDKKQEPAAINSLRVLRGMKSQAAEALPRIAALYPSVTSHDKREVLNALIAIDTNGDIAIPTLAKALKDTSPADRREALLGLMRFRSKADLFVDSLIEAVKDNDRENRLLAINIIRGLGQKAAKALPAVTALTEDKDPQVRGAAINCLAGFEQSPEVIQTLGRTIKDTNVRVRMISVSVLKRLAQSNPQAVVPLVIPILQSALESEKHEPAKRSIKATIDTLNGLLSARAKPQSPEKQQKSN
jgi:HEAT repeat protein